MNSQKTLRTSDSWASCEVSFVSIFLDKSQRYKGVNCISFSCQKLQVNDTQTAYLDMIWQEDGWRETTSDATPQIDDTDTQPAG